MRRSLAVALLLVRENRLRGSERVLNVQGTRPSTGWTLVLIEKLAAQAMSTGQGIQAAFSFDPGDASGIS